MEFPTIWIIKFLSGMTLLQKINENSTVPIYILWKCLTSIKCSTFRYSEPNNGGLGNEQCVQTYTIKGSSASIGEWNDIACNQTYQSICEMGDEVIW